MPMRAPETLLPADAPVVFRGNLEALRASPHYSAVDAWLRSLAGANPQHAEALISLLERTDEVWGALVTTGAGEIRPVVIARGRFTRDDARRIIESADPPATPAMRAGVTLHYRGDEAFSLVGDHTMIIGARGAVEGALDLQESGNGTGPTDPVVTSAMDRIGFRQAALGLSARVTESIYQELQLPSMLYSSLESASFAVNVDDAVHGAFRVRTSSSMVAATLVALGRGQLAEARRQPEIAALGLSALFDGLTLSSEGQEAWARLELAGADVASIVGSITALFGSR
ncbi:MAG: hypothetical protein H5U40_04570 [Polyangiaceae bacterium]|nr:hypothetical protein [Polyangiaceae bacterium]